MILLLALFLYIGLPFFGLFLYIHHEKKPLRFSQRRPKIVDIRIAKVATTLLGRDEKVFGGIDFNLIKKNDKIYITGFQPSYLNDSQRLKSYAELNQKFLSKGAEVNTLYYGVEEQGKKNIKSMIAEMNEDDAKIKKSFHVKIIDTALLEKENQEIYNVLKTRHFLLIDSKSEKQLWIEGNHPEGEFESKDNKYITNAENYENYKTIKSVLLFLDKNSRKIDVV